MNHDIVVGIDHPIAPWFVVEKLSAPGRHITCLASAKRPAFVLSAQIEELLRSSLGDERAEHALGRLSVVDRWPARAQAAPDDDANAELFLFLTATDLSALLHEPGDGSRLLGSCRPTRVRVIVDTYDLASDHHVSHSLNQIEHALASSFPASTEISMHCMGPYVCNADMGAHQSHLGASPIQEMIGQVVDVILDVTRRVPDYFTRYPMRLCLPDAGAIRIMSAGGAAAHLARAQHISPGRYLVQGAQSCTMMDVLETIARTTQTAILVSSERSDDTDTASSIVSNAVRRIAERYQPGGESFRAAGLIEHQVEAERIDVTPAVERVLNARDDECKAMQLSFTALPDLHASQAAGSSLNYFTYGTGPEVLLIVNAFGLSLDFWRMLAGALQEHFTLIAMEVPDGTTDQLSISRTYYSADNYVDVYVSAVQTVLRAERIDRCHVMSWCSGAKLALELAGALPNSIASLTLIAPSFAGIEANQGGDSAYEKNLHTMCKIVRQTPKAAGNMANSLMAIMQKSGADLERFRKSAKDAVDVMELADACHLPLLYQPFASAPNMLEFSKQLMHFRGHDIMRQVDSELLRVPVMLITGRTDTTTSSARAKDICGRLGALVGFEIEGGSHYLIHQNYRIVAELLKAFVRDGVEMTCSDSRVERCLFQQTSELVTGEI